MYISLFRDQILNPNEDDLKRTSAEELSKLVEMAVDLATIRRKGEDSDSAEDYHRIQFVGEVEVLTPGKLDIPESELGSEGGESVYQLPVVRTLDCVTSEAVVEAAARQLLSSQL